MGFNSGFKGLNGPHSYIIKHCTCITLERKYWVNKNSCIAAVMCF